MAGYSGFYIFYMVLPNEMTKPNIQKRIRTNLLRQRGLSTNIPGTKIYPVVVPVTGVKKTPLMKMLELKYGRGKVIEEILLGGSLGQVRKQLGNEVDETTLSKWIKRFKLRISRDNLPKCDGCLHYKQDCDNGVCLLLIRMEKWELVLEKRKELLNVSS